MALFLHIVALAIGLSAGTVLVLSLFRLRDATTLADAALAAPAIEASAVAETAG